MTEKEILQQQDANGQTAFYLIAVGMFYHTYGCGAFALARATGYRVLRKQRKGGGILTCGFPASQLDTVLQRIREAGGEVEQTGEKTFLFRGLDGTSDDVARKLCMSRRTLQRKLTDERTTFQQQLNSTRLLLAQNYLRDSDRTNDDIAFLLGYEDTTSFLRAFSAWTGQTVSEYRQTQKVPY